MASVILSRILVCLAGVVALCLTARGFIAGLAFDSRNLKEMLFWLVLLAPLFCWIASALSLRLSVFLFAMDFLSLWFARALLIASNPERNPFDSMGCEYFLPLACMALALALAPKRMDLEQLLWGEAPRTPKIS